MKTLSSNYEAALKTGVVDFICICKITGTNKTTYVDKNFYISNRSLEIDDDTGAVSASDIPTQPILINSPNIIEQINVKEQTSSIGGFSIKIHNDGTFEDYNLYNRDIEIYFGDMSMDKLDDYDDSYYGVMGDITYSDTVITIQVTNSTKKVQKQVPTEVLYETIFSGVNGFAGIPEENIGKPAPTVYGDRPFYYGYDGQTTTFNMVNSQDNNMVRCYDIGATLYGGRSHYIASHKLNEIDSQYYRVWMKDKDTGRLVKLDSGDYTITNLSGQAVVNINTLTPTCTDYWFPDGNTTLTNNTAVDWSNPENSTDGDYDTFSQSFLDDSSVTSDFQKIQIDFPEYDIDDSAISSIETKYTVLFSGNGSYFRCRMTGANDSFTDISGVTKQIQSTAYGTTTAASVSANVVFNHECTTTPVPPTDSTATVYYLFKEIEYTASEIGDIFVACKCKEASSTLAGKFSGLSTGDLLENPAHIIADVIVDELGITDIGTDFQASASVLTSWKYAPYINEFINSRELLDNLAGDCKSVVRWDYENNPSMSTFKDSYITDMVINGDDCSLPVCSKTKLDDIINKLELKYKKGEAYQTSIEREDDRTNTGSQDVYNFVSNTTKETDFIVDPTTVGYLADFYCKDDADSFWSVAHNIVEVELPLVGNHNYYGGNFIPYNRLELGDVVEFTNMPIKCNDEGFIGKQFLIISVTKGTNMKIKGYEV